jgi:uncharacterized protein YbdZ (MbtH family)
MCVLLYSSMSLVPAGWGIVGSGETEQAGLMVAAVVT